MANAGLESESTGKTRVQLDLPPTTVERLNWIMHVCEMGSRKELFDNALSVLEWTVGEVSSGRKVVSLSEENTDPMELTMPILQTARVAARSRHIVAESVPAQRRAAWLQRNLPAARAQSEETRSEGAEEGLGLARGT